MTIRTKRRGRRSLAAILAAMLMASVLAVVAGAPAQAANTSGEALVDTNDDGTPDAREFAGRDRYDTANRLTANFGKFKGLGNVPVAFVASGTSLVDAISVAGLAGFLDAPVLLTPMDSLNGGVADFIEDYGVQTVHVLGGTAVVADSVVESIEALVNGPMVNRIAESDRYGTAAAVASRLGGGAAWCGGAEAAAVLANGGDVSLGYAMAISPVANRLQLPLLLTAADELAEATEGFITDEDIEHVVIMGGESSVSDDVSAALTSAGVDTVTRIDGDTPAEASVALAELITDGCKADLGLVEDDTVALVAESGVADGVVASSILASSYRSGSLVPMLVVGDELPAAVSDYLAATPSLSGTDNKLHMQIVAVGGTAAVSDEVMQAALDAAASADALTAQITSETNVENSTTEWKPPQAGEAKVVLRFSDNIVQNGTDPITTDLTDLIRDNLEVNGAPARLVTGTAAIEREDSAGVGATQCRPDEVTVTLASPLKAGDVISLAGGAKFGANMDSRTVAGTSVTVPDATRDTSAPVVTVIAIAVTNTEDPTFAAVFFDSEGLDTANGNNMISTDEIMITSTVTKTAGGGPYGNNGRIAALLGGSPTTYEVGDRITIKSGALVDTAGNKSRARTFSVLAAQASPRITAVTMSEMKHTAQAVIAVPAAIAPQVDSVGITISAKKGGAADGAAGNGWTIAFDRATGWKADPTVEVDIDVRVNAKDRLVSVRFNAGDAKFADLKAALEANSAFDALFMVNLPADASGACGATANNPLVIGAFGRGLSETSTGGKTAVAIEVRFNAYALAITAGAGLGDDVFAEAAKRYRTDVDANLATTGLVAAINAIAGDGTRLGRSLVNNDDGTAGTDVDAGDIGGLFPVRYELETDNALLLPRVRDLVTTAAGYDRSVDGADQTVEAATAVATSYAADVATTTKIQEDKNAGSQVRIGQSGSVEAPDFK